ncbi:ABC transporter ATP-binding protein [Clostridium tetani]|uniref:ABC transporter ATP-binding protein n=1 Tax=Clostridium tetani (strain Massachusetts / E88) TaxID=212717 RepID=Q897T0_CLOTE|nr:ABC transporter ATP-binding protein [Clostridium tetani]AAO35256.1 ABC transporter ATP-binding protein [Clostridium tetani E88]KGI38514.1 ABC transporter ATP-binding protein [Clostridium tetani ATCC 9441]KGI40962.1 ABC transporter ATP-binding protein [Clostridium tetani]KGI41631.1 ABC transporter ATP-binding protein [Clostridium tetani]KGI46048.1 ABC transporter ATP-binding protein [Clostridium tetani]
MQNFISIKNVNKTYNKKKVLNNINLEIGNGMFGLLGHNGAGKTTLMKIITTLITPDKGGKIKICGQDIKENKMNIRKIIGFLPQEFNIYPQMSAYEFLDYIALLNNIHNKNVRDELICNTLSKVNLLDHKNGEVGQFSGGMKRRLGIAQAIIKNPSILVVDEPTAGLDPEERIKFRTMLVELSEDRIVILSTHIVEDISASCEKLALLLSGELKFVGTPDEFIKNTEGYVWEKIITDNKDLIGLKNKYSIISIKRTCGTSTVRFLGNSKDVSSLSNVNSVYPNLEDAYLYFMQNAK